MFCLNYYPSENYLKDAEEFKIQYRPADRTLEDFLETYQDKSIVIDVNQAFDELDAKLLKGLYQKYHNFKLIVNFSNEEYFKRIQEYEIPFFFSNFVTTIDQLHGLLKYHPTDMYICEELGFSLDRISELLHANNVKVRMIPNICQSSFPETESLLTFFIRPEDIKAYSTFVDVFELIADQLHQQTIYKIYKQGYWAGPIKQVIPNFKDNLDSRFVMDYFGAVRLKCGKRCLYKPEVCDICHRFVQLADTFKNKNMYIKKKRTNS